jgi:salicylate hydroxylase
LSPLLGHAKTTKDTVNALKAYDEVRRPRTQRIVESSWVTGELMTGRGGETKMPLDQVKEKLVHRWDVIFGIELEKHRDEAISIMDRLVQGEGS